MINLRLVWSFSTAGLEGSGFEGAVGTLESADDSRHSLGLDMKENLE